MKKQLSVFEHICPMIGGTPLLEVRCTVDGRCLRIFAKNESYNLTGSIKDRVAYHILKTAYENGSIRPGMTIAEATSGNTGIAFAALGTALGHPVTIFMPDWMSPERVNMMKSYGAAVHLVSKEEGGFLGSVRMCEELQCENGVFLPRQFSNPDNSEAHYRTTGAEIVSQLSSLGLSPDGFVAGVGTGGTVMGISRRLKEAFPSCRSFALEPASSPTLSTGYKVGSHRIQGISDDFIPDLLQLSQLDGVVAADDGDAILMAQMLSRQLGIGVGISSGANFIGCLKIARQLPEDAVLVTVFSDDNKKYLSTDYAKEEPVREGYYSPRVRLTDVIAHR